MEAEAVVLSGADRRFGADRRALPARGGAGTERTRPGPGRRWPRRASAWCSPTGSWTAPRSRRSPRWRGARRPGRTRSPRRWSGPSRRSASTATRRRSASSVRRWARLLDPGDPRRRGPAPARPGDHPLHRDLRRRGTVGDPRAGPAHRARARGRSKELDTILYSASMALTIWGRLDDGDDLLDRGGPAARRPGPELPSVRHLPPRRAGGVARRRPGRDRARCCRRSPRGRRRRWGTARWWWSPMSPG